jgi:hypothetical protein
MGSRFGRNKRRAAREKIERLTAEKRWVEIQRDGAKYEAANARQKALDMFIEHGDIYKDAIRACSYALGRALGEELNQHKDKLLSMLVHKEPLLKCEYEQNITADRVMNVMHVHIPLREIHYRQIVL